MSDEREAAWYEYKRTHAGLFPDARLDFESGFDAGRASRGAEVAGLTAKVERNAPALFEETMSAVLARAEAAEAVVAAVNEYMDTTSYHPWKDALSAILNAAPQTVLAERQEYGDPYSCADLGHENCDGTHPDHGPYTEKGQSNARRELSNVRGVASPDPVSGLGDGVGGPSVLDYAEATAKYVGVDPELVRAALAAAVSHPEPTEEAK